MNIGMQWLKNTRQYQETFLYPVVNLGKMDFGTKNRKTATINIDNLTLGSLKIVMDSLLSNSAMN